MVTVHLSCSHEDMIELHRKLRKKGFVFGTDYSYEQQSNAWDKSLHHLIVYNDKLLNTKEMKRFLLPYMI